MSEDSRKQQIVIVTSIVVFIIIISSWIAFRRYEFSSALREPSFQSLFEDANTKPLEVPGLEEAKERIGSPDIDQFINDLQEQVTITSTPTSTE